MYNRTQCLSDPLLVLDTIVGSGLKGLVLKLTET